MGSNTLIRLVLALIVLFCSSLAIGQSRKVDRLEQYYDQGHYKMVYRKSSRLIKNPEFNSTLLPAYYKAMSSFQLMQNQSWLRRNDADVKESIALINKVILSSEWSRIKETHANELAAMQLVFDVWLAKENNAINKEQSSYIENWILTIFRELNIVVPNDEFRDSDGLIPEGFSIKQRTQL